MNINLKLTPEQFDALHELMKAEAYAASRNEHGGEVTTYDEYRAAYDLLVEEVPLEG